MSKSKRFVLCSCGCNEKLYEGENVIHGSDEHVFKNTQHLFMWMTDNNCYDYIANEGELVLSQSYRNWLPSIGDPIYDLRRRKFGICVGVLEKVALVHIEGDRKPKFITPEMDEFEYPKFYINDEVKWKGEEGYFIKHAHYHVPKDKWEYTITKLGIEGFDRYTVEQDDLDLVQKFISKI